MSKGERFETKLARLEKLVDQLERGDLPLEDSLKAFEEGMRLAKGCEDKLDEVQKKVEILTREGKRRRFEP